jgi:hypothetical protein
MFLGRTSEVARATGAMPGAVAAGGGVAPSDVDGTAAAAALPAEMLSLRGGVEDVPSAAAARGAADAADTQALVFAARLAASAAILAISAARRASKSACGVPWATAPNGSAGLAAAYTKDPFTITIAHNNAMRR